MQLMNTTIDNYVVIGNPITQSLSPQIHTLFAQQTGQSLSYQRLYAELDQFSTVVKLFQTQGGKGANITLPFKEQAYRLATQCSSSAQLAKAVNTLSFQADGTVLGDNTDGIGLIKDLDYLGWELKAKRILIIGAGGAVRGILGPLLQESPEKISILNRHVEKAQQLAAEFLSLGSLAVTEVAQLSSQQFDLIINTLPLGICSADLIATASLIKPNTYCYDLSYKKELTEFLFWAKQQGCQRCADGFGMLIEQAAESFYLWRGVRPDVVAARIMHI